jgi:choline-sulfatase
MNFVIFMPDQQRAESVSCYGHPLVRMPNYDRLAAEGTRFDQCHVTMPLCSPSRVGFMTGWYPHTRGHRTLGHLLRAGDPSLFRYLREAGYRVEAYGKNDVFSPEHAALALDHWDERPGKSHAGPGVESGNPLFNTHLAGPSEGTVEEIRDMRNVAAGIEFLRSERARRQPFCLFLPLIMPHPRYGAPEPFHDMYDPDAIPPLRPVREDRVPLYHRLMREYRGLDKVDESVFRRIQAIYLGMNSCVDWMLGQLMAALDETGLSETTTLIVVADHGDFAGDYGLVEKYHSCLLDVMTRVPLIIRTPGGVGGHVVREQTQHFDVMATILELAGIEARHTHFARSLAPQLGGDSGDPGRAVMAEGGYNASEKHCFEGHNPDAPTWNPNNVYYAQTLQFQERPESNSRACMIRTLDWKLVYRVDDARELYDLRNDPRETRNLHGDPVHADIQGRMTELLLESLVRASDVTPFDENARGWPPSPPLEVPR